jgi:hypothetical protein
MCEASVSGVGRCRAGIRSDYSVAFFARLILESEVMKDLSSKNFGLLIAYIVPGAIVLIGLAAFSPVVQTWLLHPSTATPSIGGFLFVTLASVAAGMTASAVRWATIDRLHHWTGIEKPAWDDSRLPERLEAFEALVEAHYRYYQFHSNSLVAMLFSYAAWRPSLGGRPVASDLGIAFLAAIFFAVSRDNLRRYYGRAAVLLGPLNKEFSHEQRSHPARVSSVQRHAQSAEKTGYRQEGSDEDPAP